MKDILVYAREFQDRTPACRYAAPLAAAFGASMTGVYVCPSPLDLAFVYEAAFVATLVEDARAQVQDALASRRAFVDWAAAEGVPDVEWLVVEGNPVDALVRLATRHDLLVLDHPIGSRGDAWDLPGLILRAGIPCVVLPSQPVSYEPIVRAAIGWNDSPEATRAVHSALPFLQGKQVLLLRGEERDRYPRMACYPPFDIEGFLGRRGVSVESRNITAKPDDVGRALMEEAARFGAGLLVMGACGRARFSEWLLGGTTRGVLTWAKLPVWLQH